MSEERVIENILSIDIETAGRNPHLNPIRQIGGIVMSLVRTRNSFKVVLHDSLDVCLKMDSTSESYEKRCMKEFWNTKADLLTEIDTRAVDKESGYEYVHNFIRDARLNYEKIKIVTDFPEFDIARISLELTKHKLCKQSDEDTKELDEEEKRYPPLYYHLNKWYGSSICIDSVARGICMSLGVENENPDCKDVFKQFGMKPEEEFEKFISSKRVNKFLEDKLIPKEKHNAVFDAIENGYFYLSMRRLIRRRQRIKDRKKNDDMSNATLKSFWIGMFTVFCVVIVSHLFSYL